MELLRFVLDHTNPDSPEVVLAFAAILGILLVSLTSGAIRQTEEKTALELFLVFMRRAILIFLLAILPLSVLFIWGLATWHLGDSEAGRYMSMWWSEFRAATSQLWWSIAVVALAPIFFRIVLLRKIVPFISALNRRFMVRQSGDNLSDIRVEIARTKPKNFNPKNYYKPEKMFLGLDRNDRPIYIPDADFLKTHSKILGPTQTGKGVLMGVILDQAILKGWGAWFVDPKPDKFIYDIMRESAESCGREPPGILDMNGVGPGDYSPFIGGTIRDRRERLVKAFRMASTGTNADHFKLKERAIIDYLMPYWDGTLKQLKQLLEGKHSAISESKRQWIREEGGDIFEKVSEFMHLPPLLATKQNSLNIADMLDSARVMYVRSHTKDTLVRSATIALLDELVQITLLKPLPHPTLIMIDECRFLVTDSLADALATVLGNGLCMGLAYQSILDLMNIPDKSLNSASIRAGIETNTRLTISHGSDDIETAEWVSGKTGTIQKTVTRLERLTRNQGGAEEWDGERQVGSQEEALITSNQVLSLPERVAALKRPGHLAELIFTCWVAIKDLQGIPKRQTNIQDQFEAIKNQQRPSAPAEAAEQGSGEESASDEPAQPQTDPATASTSTQDHSAPKTGKAYQKLSDDESDAIAKAAAEILKGGRQTDRHPKDENSKPNDVDLSSLDDIKGI